MESFFFVINQFGIKPNIIAVLLTFFFDIDIDIFFFIKIGSLLVTMYTPTKQSNSYLPVK